jgi:hypothetical protein
VRTSSLTERRRSARVNLLCCLSVEAVYTVGSGSAVGIATCYGLDYRELEFESRKGLEFSVLHIVQTGSGAHPASYPMGTECSFPRG